MPVALRDYARQLRKNATAAERALWRNIHARQIEDFRFRRQVVLHGFIVDFACYEARLVVEVDGATHSTAQEIQSDAARDAALKANGDSVLRFTNDEVFHNIGGVLESIRLKLIALRPRIRDDDVQALRDPPPRPSPTRGEGGRAAPPSPPGLRPPPLDRREPYLRRRHAWRFRAARGAGA